MGTLSDFDEAPLALSFEDNGDTSDMSVQDGRSDYLPIDAKIQGEVLRIVFTSQDGAYCVIRIRTSGQKSGETTLVGALAGVMEGQEIEAEGRWENHREHGRQFRVSNFRALLPKTPDGLVKYLASGILPGVGDVYARRLVDHFGTKIIDVLDNYSERLKEVPGLGKKRLADIRAAWKENSSGRETLIYLQGLGISSTYAQKIIEKYSAAAAPEIVRNNPYTLAYDINGIGFLLADRIAMRLGLKKNDVKRLCSGIFYTLKELADRGNVCYPSDALAHEASKLLDVTYDEAVKGLEIAIQERKVVLQSYPRIEQGKPFAYLRQNLEAERVVAKTVEILSQSAPRRAVQASLNVSSGAFTFNEGQRQAILNAFAYTCSIITGGPGVGKTTVLSQIVKNAKASGLKVALASPTGRAAKRLSEAAGMEAKTIHRLLKWQPQLQDFEYGLDNPLSCDMLIVDECSMLDITLAASLLKAITPGTFLVLVGDKDQLPSVGPGTVLNDLIASGKMAVTYLTEVYRQSDDSRIITNAHKVNGGQLPDLHPIPAGTIGDFYWIEQDDPDKVAVLIAKMVTERIPAAFGYHPLRDVQILSPMRKGQCGTTSLNSALQGLLNPGGENGKPEITFGSHAFRLGDKVMQISNNYDKAVFNGEMGYVTDVDPGAHLFTVTFEQGEVMYKQEEAAQLVLAYAVTIHKSQGSEFPVVIMPVLTQHFIMLQRNLIYTGMTRAKKLLIMIGSRKALSLAVRNNEPVRRVSLLKYRLL